MNSAGDQEEDRQRVALSARQLELDLFWKRALFFWGFIATAFAGAAAMLSNHPGLAITISSFGLVCSFCWTLANRGSKFWYEAWEQIIKTQPIGSVFEEANRQKPKSQWWSTRFSVSKLAIALSDYVTGLWIALIIYQLFCILHFSGCTLAVIGASVIVLLSVGYMVYVFRTTKHKE